MCDGHVLGEPLKLAHATACRAGRLFISPSSLAVCTIHFPEWFILYVSYSSIFPCSVQEQILQYGSSIIVRSFIANALELALFSSLLRYVAFLAVHRRPASHTCQTPNSNTVGICCCCVAGSQRLHHCDIHLQHQKNDQLLACGPRLLHRGWCLQVTRQHQQQDT